MTDIVLVHGAFRGAWAWDRVGQLLKVDGHRVFAPSLTAPDATLESYVGELVALFERSAVSDALLVGHSQGGFIARAASQRLAERVRRLVYFDAPVPRDGETAFDFRPDGAPVPDVQRGDVIQPFPTIPGNGLSAEDSTWINDRLVAQPVAPSMDPVVVDDPAALALPESFVFFAQTPPGFPCEITRTRLDAAGVDYSLIDAPHDGIVTDPLEVAALILALA